jgi:hypothetical protein
VRCFFGRCSDAVGVSRERLVRSSRSISSSPNVIFFYLIAILGHMAVPRGQQVLGKQALWAGEAEATAPTPHYTSSAAYQKLSKGL